MLNEDQSETSSDSFHPADTDQHVLIWDGNCGFCSRCVEWLRMKVPEGVRFVPYQNVSKEYDEIDRSEFDESVFLIQPSGAWSRGAEAIFRTLRLGPEPALSIWLYWYLPGFDRISEWGYRVVAENRSLFSRISWLLFGSDRNPSRWRFARWLFLRGLALVFLIAFFSLLLQLSGLIGPDGIVPAKDAVKRARNMVLESDASWYSVLLQFPTIFLWVQPTDFALHGLCGVGMVCSFLLLIGFWPRGFLFFLWGLYLSFVAVGGPFLSYQWDTLLLETSLMAVILAPAQILPGGDRRRVSFRGVFLLHWLLFRVMFSSGFVKLFSLDPVWHNGTALHYHFWTQPLPNSLSYYVNQLPEWLLVYGTGGTFLLELLVPFLFFAPRMMRRIAGISMIGFQILIMATGNYGFFNVLTIVLCFLLIDDAFWEQWIPAFLWNRFGNPEGDPDERRTLWRTVTGTGRAIGVLVLFTGTALVLISQIHSSRVGRKTNVRSDGVSRVVEWFDEQYQSVRSLRTFNTYGLFANMTTERPEITIEGSTDGNRWKSYPFSWKPDSPDDAPRVVAPHQPRLDWQMWFQALRMHRRFKQCPEVLTKLGVRPASLREKLCREPGWYDRTDLGLMREMKEAGINQPISWMYQNLWGFRQWFMNFLTKLLKGEDAVLRLLESNPFPEDPPQYIRVRVEEYTFSNPGRNGGKWWRTETPRMKGWPFQLKNGKLTPAGSPN